MRWESFSSKELLHYLREHKHETVQLEITIPKKKAKKHKKNRNKVGPTNTSSSNAIIQHEDKTEQETTHHSFDDNLGEVGDDDSVVVKESSPVGSSEIAVASNQSSSAENELENQQESEDEKRIETFRKALFITDIVLLSLTIIGGITCLVLFTVWDMGLDPLVLAVIGAVVAIQSICLGFGIWGVQRKKASAVIVTAVYCMIALAFNLFALVSYTFNASILADLVLCIAMFTLHTQYVVLLKRRGRIKKPLHDGSQTREQRHDDTDIEQGGKSITEEDSSQQAQQVSTNRSCCNTLVKHKWQCAFCLIGILVIIAVAIVVPLILLKDNDDSSTSSSGNKDKAKVPKELYPIEYTTMQVYPWQLSGRRHMSIHKPDKESCKEYCRSNSFEFGVYWYEKHNTNCHCYDNFACPNTVRMWSGGTIFFDERPYCV